MEGEGGDYRRYSTLYNIGQQEDGCGVLRYQYWLPKTFCSKDNKLILEIQNNPCSSTFAASTLFLSDSSAVLATQVACLELTGIIVLFIDQRRKKLLGWRLCHSVVLYFWSFFYVSHFAYLDCTSLTLWTAGFLSLTSVVFLKGTVSATSLFLFTSWGLTKLLEINAHPPPPPPKKKKNYHQEE